MAYKALRAVRGVNQSRDAMRRMQKMGMKVDEVGPVTEVVIRSPEKEIVIQNPAVTAITLQGEKIYQIAGGKILERSAAVAEIRAPSPPEIPPADIELVASQTGRSLEEAKRALRESQGDLAKAILSLKQKQ